MVLSIGKKWMDLRSYLSETTSHPLATAYLHILEPRKPFPPATTTFFLAARDAALAADVMMALLVHDGFFAVWVKIEKVQAEQLELQSAFYFINCGDAEYV